MSSKFLRALALVTMVSGASARASAEEPLVSLSQGTRFSAEVDDLKTELGFDLRAQVAVLPTLMLDVDVPWSASVDPEMTGGEIGNLRVGAHSAWNVAPNLVVHAGLALSAPTNSPPLSSGLADGAANVRAFFDQDLYLLQTFGVRVPGGVEARLGRYVYLRTDLAVLGLIPIGGGSPALVLEHSDELELRSASGWGGGLRFQLAVGLHTGSGYEPEQGKGELLLEPFVGYEPPHQGLFARLGAFGNLPYPRDFAVLAFNAIGVQLMVGYKL